MSDVISRQVALSAICSACGKIDCDKMDKCEKLQLPPANCSEFPNSSDTISRQAAIEVIDSFNVFESRCDQIKLEQMIGELPPAQPEIIRCKDCKHKPSGDATEHDITFPDDKCPCQCEDFWYSWIPSDDWYCGSAERREVTE